MAVRILVVDDEESARDLVSMHLSLQGYVVETAADGEDAIASLEHGSFDVVVLDIEMPRKDGFAVLRHIKSNHMGVHPIMLTGFEDPRAMYESVRWGADGYLPKPYNFHDLVEAIESVLN